MPRHSPPEVRHEACERMLAGEAIKDGPAPQRPELPEPTEFEDPHSTHIQQAALS